MGIKPKFKPKPQQTQTEQVNDQAVAQVLAGGLDQSMAQIINQEPAIDFDHPRHSTDDLLSFRVPLNAYYERLILDIAQTTRISMSDATRWAMEVLSEHVKAGAAAPSYFRRVSKGHAYKRGKKK